METAEIPQIKLAKVGGRRERKKGGLAWFGRGAGGSFSGATGGLGGFSGLGGLSLLAKSGVAVLLSVLGAGAYNVGQGMTPALDVAGHKQSLFASKDAPATATVDASAAAPAVPSGL